MRFKRKKTAKNNAQKKQRNPLHNSLQENIYEVKNTLGNSSDIVARKWYINTVSQLEAAVLYIDGLIDSEAVRDLMDDLSASFKAEESATQDYTQQNIIDVLKNSSLSAGNITVIDHADVLFSSILSGSTVILIDGHSKGISISTQGGERRAITQPTSEQAVRGPQEGFTESIRTNTSLVRRKIKSPELWLETKQIGTATQTDVAIMYMNGIVNKKVVEEVRRRLDQINIDSILESGYIEELIQDEAFTFFPTIYNTERPDVAAANLLEGRVLILIDGTPFVLIAPATFIQYFQVSEDYFQRATMATFLRFLRVATFFIALLAPSVFIAVTTFHHEMIPPSLLISLAAQRDGVPFPVFVEALIMELTFEVLREAGVRMPQAAGQAVSIVGTFVIGIAAVEAGLVSAAIVIVVSITAISSFVFPSFDMGIAIRLLRFPMMFLAAAFGLFGITIGIIALILHLTSLRSFGIPYMAPFGPFIAADQKDAIFRVPWKGMLSRPRLMNQKNVMREQKPPMSKSRSKQQKE